MNQLRWEKWVLTLVEVLEVLDVPEVVAVLVVLPRSLPLCVVGGIRAGLKPAA
ncbi:hypothetical protein [Streptomyces sp. NPDC088719]|uniref:hypothetical protein n=1 Tax=Streptomyces sp. NPDC088719 TaxID=3365872 RepID=UPI0037F55928